MKVIMKCVNIKLWDILGCFHYIVNAPRSYVYSKYQYFFMTGFISKTEITKSGKISKLDEVIQILSLIGHANSI